MNQPFTQRERVFVSPKLQLQDTGKYGLGLYSTQDLAPGEVLYDEGQVLRKYYTRQEILHQPDSGHFQTFSYVIDTNTYFSGDRSVIEHDITNFMNHACDPNAWFDQDNRMRARRFIPAGSEVTCDYATFETEISFHRGLQCSCGSDQCRGLLTGREYRDRHFQERYQGHLSSYIERLLQGPSWYDDRLYVREGQVGPGVFAMHTIEAGETITCYSGRIVNRAEMEQLPENRQRFNFQVGPDLFQVPLSDTRELPDFINHACQPSAGLADSIRLVALRTIQAEEEITLDYATFNSGVVHGASDNFDCLCASPTCRHQIRSDDFRLPDVERRLFHWYSPYLKELVRSSSARRD
ncbi:MAG: SET domain-containing protein [Leptospiraceae bacterium]|nr:SET domain-containing protein [Leptospiraceae bacterium]